MLLLKPFKQLRHGLNLSQRLYYFYTSEYKKSDAVIGSSTGEYSSKNKFTK